MIGECAMDVTAFGAGMTKWAPRRDTIKSVIKDAKKRSKLYEQYDRYHRLMRENVVSRSTHLRWGRTMVEHDDGIPRREALKRGALATGAVIIGSTAATGPAAAGIGEGRVGDYHLNNIRPNGTVKDASPEKNHGTNHGADVINDGAVGNAIEFDGAGDYIEVSDDESVDAQDAITISFWFKLNGESGDNQWPRAVSKGQSTTSNGAYGVFVKDSSDPTDIGLRFIDEDGSRYDVRDKNLPSYDDDLWHHVAATYSDEDDEGRLYVDKMAPVIKEIPGDVKIRTTDDDLHIGDGNDERHFNGMLDEVRIYDRALSEDEIYELAEQAYAVPPFLNEEALGKESPVWDTGVADETGEDEVEVLFGGMTDIDLPYPDAPDMGPWGMDPRAVEISPGTDVTWTWYDGEGAIDAHHLVSFFNPPYEEEFELPWESDGHGHEHPGGEDEFYVHEDLGDTFTYTFEEPGIYLYFCIPHGTPFSFQFGELGEVSNLFGQRGAVIVSDD